MAKKDRPFSFGRTTEELQGNVQRAGPAAAASYTLIGALVVLGGLGYAVDLWRSSSPWGLLIGLTLGVIVGFYELMRTMWR